MHAIVKNYYFLFKYGMISILFSQFLHLHQAFAQCAFTPSIFGESTMCAGSVNILQTQAYDSYQWYKRGFTDFTAVPIAGADQQMLSVTQTQTYYSVEVVLNGCAERSAEFFVEEWAFILPYTSVSGNHTFSNDIFTVCEGEPFQIYVHPPYHSMITWYHNANPFLYNTPYCTITESGIYQASASPDACPNMFYNQLTLPLKIEVVPCATAVLPTLDSEKNTFRISPNIITHGSRMYIPQPYVHTAYSFVVLYNQLGQSVYKIQLNNHVEPIVISSTPFPTSGIYLAVLYVNNAMYATQSIIVHKN